MEAFSRRSRRREIPSQAAGKVKHAAQRHAGSNCSRLLSILPGTLKTVSSVYFLRELPASVPEAGESDENVGFAAAERGFEAMDRRQGSRPAIRPKTSASIRRGLQGSARIAEKLIPVGIEALNCRSLSLVSVHDLTEACGEYFRIKGAFQYVPMGLAGI